MALDKISVTTFYRFLPLDESQITHTQTALEALAGQHPLRGLILLGREGINATASGTSGAIAALKQCVTDCLGVTDIHFKDSLCSKHPFNVFKVKIREEIVSLGRPEVVPRERVNHHMSPADWHAALQDPETVVLDTRNDYEVAIGKFKTARDFALKEFNEFPDKLRAADLDKNKRVLIYCTGGIRCEKAILEMHEQGYTDVHQLDGGILNYLKEFPEKDFAGECFVFDYRVAVDQQLEATEAYRLCPHCGQPACSTVRCTQCGREEMVCGSCQSQGIHTCSKNCAHHSAIGSNSKATHQQELRKRRRV